MIAAFRNGQRHPFYKALTALLVMQLVFPVALIQPVMAELITDPRADVQFRPVINNSQGVPVVNIVRPGNNGVSHNKYQDFDVDANGLVFNNSLVNGHSFLAGQLLANPALGGRSASVILNEVTGASDSDLNGLMEVFGDKANIIIANPNGITCDGCGFINTDRASMITGRSFYSDDQLNFDIRDGSVRIEGEGLSYRYKPKALDLLGRYIGIHGEVDVPDSLNIIAGTYDLNYDALISDDNSSTAVTVKSPEGTPDRALAIDASVFGAMQAGKINIMGTEKGLGVKADGYLFSHADDLFISSAGGLTVSDADAFKKLTLVAEDELNITDDLIANLSVSVSGNVVSTGDTTSIITQNLTINADSEIDLNGETKSLNLLLSSNNLKSSANLLVLNEADIQTVDNALFQDGDIRINTASLVGGKFGFLDSVLSVNILNANAHQWGINNSRFEVSDLTLATDESYIDNAYILVNQLDVNAGSMVVTGSRMSGLDMRFQGSSLGLTDSSWLFNNINAKTEALNLKQALLMSYRTDLNTAVLISENSSYYSEVLQFRAGADFTSQGDTFQILSFGGEIGESDAGTLDINAGNADFSDTNIRTERFNLTGNNLTLSAGEMLASDLFVTSSSFVAKESARIVATNELAVVSDTIVANAQMYGGNLSVEAADAVLSGRYEAADNMSITSGQLATKNSVISARSLAVSGQDLALDATQINAQDVVLSADDDASFSGSVSAEDLKISAQDIDITGQMQLENSAQLTATNALSANSILITADDFAATASQLSINQADIQTGAIQLHANKDAKLSGSIVANELTLTADNAEVSGDYALSDTMVVTAGNRLKSDRIVAQAIDLMLSGNNLEINNNQLTASHISLEAQQDIELSGSVKGKVLLVNGRNADISGHYNLADNLSVTAENQLTINDSDITAKNFSLSGNDLKASEVTVFAENAKLEAMNDASLSASVTGNSLSINAQNVNLSGQYQLAGNVQISAENRLTTDDAEINTADLALSATDLTFSQTDIRAVNSQLTAKKDLTFSGSVVGTSLSVQASNNASLTGNYALSDVLSVAAGNELKVNGIVAEAVNLMLAGDRVSADSAVLESDQTVLTATNDLILSGSIVGNDLIINAANADISGQYGLSNSLSVATTNQLMADNMIAVTDQLKLDGQILVLTNADITADSLYLTSRQDTQLSGAVKGNNLIIRAANADLSGQYQLSDQLSVIASDKLTGQDVSASAKNISLGSQNINLTSADLAADNIHLVADEDIKISGSASGNNLTIAAQNTDLSGQYQFSDNITARAENQMSTNNADITTASLILTAADLVLTETNIVADSTELVADRDLSLSGTMKGNSLTARSGSDAQLSGEYVLSDTLSVTTGRDLIIDGVVAQAVNLMLNGDNLQAHNVMLGADQAKLMANQNLTISGSLIGNSLDLTASNVNVAGDYKLADNLNIVVADKLTATDADFTTSDLNLAGNNISAVNIDINAEATSLIAKQNLNLSGSVSGNDLIVQAGFAEIDGSYSLADQLSVIAQSDITSTTVSINANNLNLKADNITLDNLEVSAGGSYLNADKNISLTGTGSAPVISGDHLSVNAGTDITLTGSYLLADDMSVTAGHDLDVDNIVASSVNILLQGNSISAHGVTLEVNEAQLNSNNELSLDGDISGNNLTVTADQAEISGSFDLSSTLSVITDNELFIDDAHLSASALALKADDLVMNNVSLTTDTASLVADNDIELKTITANTTTASLDDDYQWSDQFSVSAGNNLVINNMVSAAINQMLNAGNNAQLHSVELLADTATIITAQQLDLKGRVDATSLNLTAADASVSGTYKLADSLAITTSNDLALNNTDINSDKLSLAGNNVNVSASRVNADDIQLTAAQQLNLVAAIAGESLTVTADTASLQGQFDLSDTLSLTTDTHAVLNNSDVVAKNLEFRVADGEALLKNSSIITTSTDLIADDVNIKNSILNGASVEISSNNLILDADSELGADNVDINVAGRVENSGSILAADELSVIGSNISNNGSVASFANAVIKAANVFENNGVLTADNLVLIGSDVINNNQLGAEYLELTYQNLANNAGADLVSGNTVYTAKSDTALFNNHGTQTITGTMSWQSEGGSAGTYINTGTLQGSQDVNFSGLANVSNNGDMAVKGTLNIGGEKFVQQGEITAGTLRIDRNNKESFSNQGYISVSTLNARSDADFINDGIIEADNADISFVADAAFINNAAKTFSSENLTVINGAVNNQGNIETNNAAFTGNGSQVFSNSGSLIQSAGNGTHHGVTVTGFGTLKNTGKIEADDLVELRMIQAVNNASSGQGIVASGMLADQIGTFDNHSTISVNALNTSVANMLNTGIIGAKEAKITVDGTLNNQGYLYQTGGSNSPSLTNIIGSTAGQFNIQSFGLKNGSADGKGSIEIRNGHLLLSDGSLINTGLIQAQDSNSGNDTLLISGMKNLTNSGDIDLDTELVVTGGSIVNQERGYLHAVSLAGTDLTSFTNAGTTLLDSNATINAGTVLNSGLFHADKQINLFSRNITNTENAEISTARIMRLSGRTDSSLNTLNNAGLIKASGLVLQTDQFLNAE
ncbi:filamentous hemagglutinin N-terminal domain-containing protein, partial [Thalassolituus sp. UBA2009]|uniref:two-partner secretion domain-containing protein n=1 Tax=Thalassolituus sp. UBA2009 TaxID=1947658 RepID=UPI00257E3673